MLQAVDEAIVHDEIHAAVAAHFLSLFLNFHSDGVEVVLHNLVAHLSGYKAMWVKMLVFGEETCGQLVFKNSETCCRIFVGKAFSSSELIKTIVRTVSVNVMLDEQGLALFSLNHRGGHVAVGEIVLVHHFFGDFLAVVGRRAHADQSLHAVATMDVKCLTERS